MTKPARRWLAPEVVQTSAMDCGPATLKCLLEGHGVRVGYDRLREACQTDVDGTTIDTLEEIAVALGLQAEQILLPSDHLLLSGARALPCIALIRLASGETHFVVIWRQVGPFLDVMDPAVGRRWVTSEGLLAELFEHEMPVPALEWRAWAGSDDFLKPLRQRLRTLGLDRAASDGLVATALDAPGWQQLGRLDAVVRLTESLRRGGAVKPGAAALQLIDALLSGDANDAAGPLLEPHRHVRPAPEPAEDAGEQLLIRGAVLVRCTGLSTEPVDRAALPTELAMALEEPPARPLHALWRMVAQGGLMIPGVVVLAAFTAAAALALEGLLFFSFLNVGERLVLLEQRVAASVMLLALLALALVLDASLAKLLWRTGRHLELRMRTAFLQKIPHLSDRHFRSRLVSDMAERAHRTYLLRELPEWGGQVLRTFLELAFTAGAIVWLDRGAALWACAAVLLAVALPAVAYPLLQGRDLKWRTHSGALTRFHLDALLGLTPIRSHGAEDSLRRAHESLLVEWARAGFSLQRLSTAVDAVQWLIGLSLFAWLVSAHSGAEDFPAALLLFYWALKIPLLSNELAMLARRYPGYHNATLRLLEPLSSVTGEPVPAESVPAGATEPAPACQAPGVALELEDVNVRIAGHDVLEGISLHISPGEHVAIVGVSGAGKSALLGLLLGWHGPAGGKLHIDGSPLDDAGLQRLRQHTAWIDPTVQLWNRSLYENLHYGSGSDSPSIDASLTAAGLKEMLQRQPQGMQAALGEGGTLLSGGEGQRVRIGRAFVREGVRLVLLDEPFRGLGRAERSRLLSATRARWPGATLLFVTHDIAEAQGFDRVLVMQGGHVAEDGAPAELVATPGSRFAELVSLDAKAQTEVWGDPVWRRMWLEEGRLSQRSPAK